MVIVTRTDKKKQAFLLDTSEKLDKIRTVLIGKGFMRKSDSFFFQDAPIDHGDEATIPLASAMNKDNTLRIGQAQSTSTISSSDHVTRYNQLDNDQKDELFRKIGLLRSFSIGEDGKFYQTIKNLFTYKDFPDANMPQVNAEMISSYSFSKFTSELTKWGAQSGSVSVSTPYASAESEYKHEKSQTTKTSNITEYSSIRYVDRRVLVELDFNKIAEVNKEFIDAIKQKFQKAKGMSYDDRPTGGMTVQTMSEGDLEHFYSELIELLNTWGYYIPRRFTLGGALYATDQSQVSEFSEAQKEMQEFSASAKASFGKISGGASYKDSSGTESNTTSTTKTRNVSWQQIGGSKVNSIEKEYGKWAESLNEAINWNIAEIQEFYPTLALLSVDRTNLANFEVLSKVMNVLFSSGAFTPEMAMYYKQPYLNMRNYQDLMLTVIGKDFLNAKIKQLSKG
jgi:hypothetical protein